MQELSHLRWLRWCCTGIVVLLAVIAVELSALLGPFESRAQAQSPPDSGQQRMQLLDAQVRTNALLESILQHLRTQPIKVKLAGTDKDSKSESKEAPRAPGR